MQQQSEERPPATPYARPLSPSSLPPSSESFSQSPSPASSASDITFPSDRSIEFNRVVDDIRATTRRTPTSPVFPDTVQPTLPALDTPYVSNVHGTQLPHTDSDGDSLLSVLPTTGLENTADLHSTTSPIPSSGQQAAYSSDSAPYPILSPLDFPPISAAQLAGLSNATTPWSIQGDPPTPPTPPPATSNTTSPSSSLSPPIPIITRIPYTPDPESSTISIHSYSSSDSSSGAIVIPPLLIDPDGPYAERRAAVPAPPSDDQLSILNNTVTSPLPSPSPVPADPSPPNLPSSAPGGPNSKTSSLVSLPGNDEIERLYKCSWPDCTKAYGTLNHLNAHITMQKHGAKRSPNEFKELRKQWRKAQKEKLESRSANADAHPSVGQHSTSHSPSVAHRMFSRRNSKPDLQTFDDQLFKDAGSMPSCPASVRKPPPEDSSASTTTSVSRPADTRTNMSARRHARRIMKDKTVCGAPDHTRIDVTDWTEEYEQPGCRCIIQ